MAASSDHAYDVAGVRIDAFITGTWRENCYMVTGPGDRWRAVIDPGDDQERLISFLEENPVVDTSILLTHAHYDHIGAVVAVAEQTGATCRVHERDRRLLKRANLYAFSFEKKAVAVPKNVELFADGDSLHCGDVAFEVIPTPGHTPGSVCFRLGNAVFSGDTVLHRKRGRTDLPGGDADALETTISVLLSRLADDDTLYPGHGRPFPIADARVWWRQETGAKS